MHIGAHVSPAGGPAKAVERGVEAGAAAIQIFNQSPRMWRGRDYTPDEVAAFHAAREQHDMGPVLIHAVYLLNCASQDTELRAKSLDSLKLALRDGDALHAHAVVLHAGSAKAGEVAPARCPPASDRITGRRYDCRSRPRASCASPARRSGHEKTARRQRAGP